MKHILGFVLLITVVLNSCGNMVSESALSASEIDAATVIKLINSGKPVYLEGKTITGDLDFTILKNQSPENGKSIRVYIDQPLSFVNCTFTGKIICSGFDSEKLFRRCAFAKNLIFASCIFKEDINFRELDVRGITDFSKSVFEKKADFSASYFSCSNSYFSESSFNGEVLFNDCRFMGNVSFFKSFFKNTSLFQNTWFGGNANFASVSFNAYTDFSNASFQALLNMNYLKSSTKLLLNYVRFMGRMDLMQAELNGSLEIKNSDFFGVTRFTELLVSGKILIENVFFNNKSNDFSKMKKMTGTDITVVNLDSSGLEFNFSEITTDDKQ